MMNVARIVNNDNRANFKGNIKLDELGDLIPVQDTALDNAIAGKIARIRQSQVDSFSHDKFRQAKELILKDGSRVWFKDSGEIGIKNPFKTPGILNFFSWSDCPPSGKTTYANYARAVQNLTELAKRFL